VREGRCKDGAPKTEMTEALGARKGANGRADGRGNGRGYYGRTLIHAGRAEKLDLRVPQDRGRDGFSNRKLFER